ncbi:hypothetical protein MASR2M70_02820 [Bacillota bacterium]
MDKLNIYICENYVNDYRKAAAKMSCDDITIKEFPCLCSGKKNKYNASAFINDDHNEKMLICGTNCPLIKSLDLKGEADKAGVTVKTNNFCFNHFVNDKLIEYILEKGGYVITCGWLKNWRERLGEMGFDRDTAKRFYAEFCNEIVLLNTGTEPDSAQMIKELSEYLNIPYKIIETDLECLRLYLEHTVNDWRINGRSGHLKMIAELKQQRAEFATVLNIIEQVATCTKKRQVIDKVKELIRLVLCAGQVHYLESGEEYERLNSILTEAEKEILINDADNSMIVKVGRTGEYGILYLGEFLFSENINRYYDFIASISHVASLTIINALQYEIIERAKNEMTYISFHDSLTGLRNRNYYNQYIEKNNIKSDTAFFVCDIDGLKAVNDGFGHGSGDEMIIETARIIGKSFRDYDVVARVGGDEFYAVAMGCNKGEAEMIKRRIQSKIDEYNNFNPDKPFKLSLSVGMYHTSEGMDANFDWELFMNIADNRMYEEKATKRKAKNLPS